MKLFKKRENMKLFKLTLIHLFPARNTQGGYSKCDQYMVDWPQVMQNIIISHSSQGPQPLLW